jgi:hypothetical protein|nr:MAG TPA: hypothetical protein [Bacteriophage sp.]
MPLLLGTKYIEFSCSLEGGCGNDLTILYNSTLLVALITPSGVIVIPAPAVNLSYLFLSSEFIYSTVVSNLSMSAELVPTTPIVTLKTLSKVVIPKEDNPTILEVLTTTASAKVIGTNSVLD